MIRIAVVDDHPTLRAGLQSVLTAQPDLDVVGFAERVDDVWPLLEATRPDVMLLDYQLPGGDGLRVCRRVKAEALPPRVVLYSAYAGAELGLAGVLAGVDAVVDKGAPAQRLFDVIRGAAAGARELPDLPVAVREDASRRVDPEDLPILGMLLEGTSPEDVGAVLALDDPALARRLDRMLARLRPKAARR